MMRRASLVALAVGIALTETASHAASQPPAQPSTSAPAAVEVSGLIVRDTVWSGTVSVLGKVQVLSGITLTIQPGAQIRFAAPPSGPDAGQGRIYVQSGGRLVARGTEAQPIVFASATPGGLWFGIELHSGHDRDALTHCRIRDSRMGIACIATSPVIADCSFEDNQRGVSLWRQAKPILRNCKFLRNLSAIVISMQSAPTIAASHIEGSTEVGVRIDAGSGGLVESTVLKSNRVAIQKQGSEGFLATRNRFEANAIGLSIEHMGATAQVRDNEFIKNRQGLIVANKASPAIARNTFTGNDTAIHFDGRSAGFVEHNDFLRNQIAVRLSRTSHARIAWNDFSANDTAILCEYSSYPTIANNNFHGGATAIRAGDHQSFEWTRSVWLPDEWEEWARRYGRNVIVARNNYWGEEATLEMQASSTSVRSIFDRARSGDLLIDGRPYPRDEVDYRPFHPNPVSAAGRRDTSPPQ